MTAHDDERLYQLILEPSRLYRLRRAKTILDNWGGLPSQIPESDAGRVSPARSRRWSGMRMGAGSRVASPNRLQEPRSALRTATPGSNEWD